MALTQTTPQIVAADPRAYIDLLLSGQKGIASGIRGIGEGITNYVNAEGANNLSKLQNDFRNFVDNNPDVAAGISPSQFSSQFISEYGPGIDRTKAAEVLPNTLKDVRAATDATNSFAVRQADATNYGRTLEATKLTENISSKLLAGDQKGAEELLLQGLQGGKFPKPEAAVTAFKGAKGITDATNTESIANRAVVDPIGAAELLKGLASKGALVDPTKSVAALREAASTNPTEVARVAEESKLLTDQFTAAIAQHQKTKPDPAIEKAYQNAEQGAVAAINSTRSTGKVTLTPTGELAPTASPKDVELFNSMLAKATKGLPVKPTNRLTDTDLTTTLTGQINAANLPPGVKQTLLAQLPNASTATSQPVGAQVQGIQGNQFAINAASTAAQMTDIHGAKTLAAAGLAGGFSTDTQGTQLISKTLDDVGLGPTVTGDTADVRDGVMETIQYAMANNIPANVVSNFILSTSRDGGLLKYLGRKSDSAYGINIKKAIETYMKSSQYAIDVKTIHTLKEASRLYGENLYNKMIKTGFTVTPSENPVVAIPTPQSPNAVVAKK